MHKIKSTIYQIITLAPGMKQVLSKPGSCGQYESYQRPEDFPVGKQRNPFLSGDQLLLTRYFVYD